jgi:putative ABC transport system permease protein
MDIAADLRYSFRELRKRPAFTATAILSLALGIGATTAVFSVIYAVLINPFPYRDANRLTAIQLFDQQGNFHPMGYSGPEIAQLRQLKSFESVIALQSSNPTTTDGDLPEDVRVLLVQPDYPNHFGVAPIMGRWLIPSDAPPGQEPAPVIVLSHRFWQRYFLGDPHVVGRTLRLDHAVYQVVGVMPPRFMWADSDAFRPAKVTQDPNAGFTVSLRIRPDVTPDQASAELQPAVEHIAKVRPAYFPTKFRVHLIGMIDAWREGLDTTLYLLLGGVASLLLIGCANVSILLLSVGVERQHELAVRVAVGAGRSRILRQLLTESLVLAASGTAIGLFIAWRGLALILSFLPPYSIPQESVVRINIPVLLFSVALACAATIAFGLWPALQISRPNLSQLLQSGARRAFGNLRARRTHNAMVAAQVALTVLLLAAAGAAAKGFLRLLHLDLGYDPENCLSLVIPMHSESRNTWQQRSEYLDQLRAQVAALPEVEAATIASNAQPPSSGDDIRIDFLGRPELGSPEIRTSFIGSEYFSILRIPILAGSMWDHVESMRADPVAVINQSMARQYWPNGDAIGHQIRTPDFDQPSPDPSAPGMTGWLQIVGVVADSLNDGLRSPVKPSIYIPYSLHIWSFTRILARTRMHPGSIVQNIRSQIAAVDRSQQIVAPRELVTILQNEPEYSNQRMIATLFGIFSVLALALAVVGLYSVVSYSVATRTNEFGIRMALGAKAADLFRLVLSSTTTSVGAGLFIGLTLTVAFNKLATHWVNEPSRDPLILALVAALLIAAATAASLLPARRAAATDPMNALRHE